MASLRNLSKNLVLQEILPRTNAKAAVRFSLASKEYHKNFVKKGERVGAIRKALAAQVDTMAAQIFRHLRKAVDAVVNKNRRRYETDEHDDVFDWRFVDSVLARVIANNEGMVAVKLEDWLDDHDERESKMYALMTLRLDQNRVLLTAPRFEKHPGLDNGRWVMRIGKGMEWMFKSAMKKALAMYNDRPVTDRRRPARASTVAQRSQYRRTSRR